MDDTIIKKTEMMSHIDNDVEYPASKDDLVKACNEMSDMPEKDKKWFMENLPARTFKSADEVREALGA